MPDVLSHLPDVQVLYMVTAATVAALLIWAGAVLIFAPTAPDESGRQGDKNGPPPAPPRGASKATDKKPVLDETPPPSVVELAPTASSDTESLPPTPRQDVPAIPSNAPAERAIARAGAAAPVVILPVMRHRLDSHREIKDGSPEVPIVVLRSADEGGGGPPLSLVSALARSEPPVETSVIVDAHRLFVVADGSGRRVQQQLASALVVDALVAAFSVDPDDVFPANAALAPRADRLRRSVLVAQATINGRTDSEPEIKSTPLGLLAAHFAPDNRRVYVASLGANRAYRLRGGELARLNKPSPGETASDVEVAVNDTAVDDVYIFGSESAFTALGDELHSVLATDTSVERVAAHLVEAATRTGHEAGLSAIVVRVASSSAGA